MTTPTDPTLAAAPFRLSARVYWEDTDAGGVVYYANYLRYFERARTEWLRARSVGQQDLRERTGSIFVVTDASLRYRAPARLDDAIDLTVDLAELRAASMRLTQRALRGDTVLCEADIRVGCVGADDFRPRRIPAEVARLL